MWDSQHLYKVRSGYFRHLVYAMWFNGMALLIFLTGMVHALVPWLFPLTPYRLAQKITAGTETVFLRRADRD